VNEVEVVEKTGGRRTRGKAGSPNAAYRKRGGMATESLAQHSEGQKSISCADRNINNKKENENLKRWSTRTHSVERGGGKEGGKVREGTPGAVGQEKLRRWIRLQKGCQKTARQSLTPWIDPKKERTGELQGDENKTPAKALRNIKGPAVSPLIDQKIKTLEAGKQKDRGEDI